VTGKQRKRAKEAKTSATFWAILLGLADKDGNWIIPTRATQKKWKEHFGVDPKELRARARKSLGKPFLNKPLTKIHEDLKEIGEAG
jgi:hypothetical protein